MIRDLEKTSSSVCNAQPRAEYLISRRNPLGIHPLAPFVTAFFCVLRICVFKASGGYTIRMALKVYGVWRSPFVMTVVCTLHEKNADFELVQTAFEDIKLKELLTTKNPFVKVPAFEDDDLVLYESRAIARYIAAKFEGQGTPLLGSTLKQQALVNVWIEVEGQTFFPLMWSICLQSLYKFTPEQDAFALETALEKLGKVLDIYEGQLSTNKYLAGDYFSLADLFHIPMIHAFMCLVDPMHHSVFTARPRVHAWYQDISARPSWKKIIAIPDASDWSQYQRR